MTSILSAPYFHNEEAAYEFVEARLWPHGPVCPKCAVINNSAKLKGKSTSDEAVRAVLKPKRKPGDN